MAALRERGFRVQPFKAGPDYIDPAYHRLASGRASRNVDSWLLNRQAMTALVSRACVDADIAVIEGIMGLYDGRRGLGAEGSTAEIAKWLRAPVVLVLDIARTAQSAGAMAMGYHEFDREVQIIGVVLNNVANAAHLARATEAVESGAGLPVLGHLPRDPELTLPEQHPSLVSSASEDWLLARIERSRRHVESTIDMGSLLSAARSAWPLPNVGGAGLFPSHVRPPRVRVAYFRDEAFDLYQPDNLELLAAWGAELVPVSPLRDEGLPEEVVGVYVGPGFPEVYGEALAANKPFIAALRAAVASGVGIYAECGGMAYLSEGLLGDGDQRTPLAGIVPGWSRLNEHGVHLGYATATIERENLLGSVGRRLRGYEFYCSRLEPDVDQAAYRLHEPEERLEGYASGNVLASHIRLHLGSEAGLAKTLVDSYANLAPSRA
jgi:cobyrinic acid a,c-diamide synthase